MDVIEIHWNEGVGNAINLCSGHICTSSQKIGARSIIGWHCQLSCRPLYWTEPPLRPEIKANYNLMREKVLF